MRWLLLLVVLSLAPSAAAQQRRPPERVFPSPGADEPSSPRPVPIASWARDRSRCGPDAPRVADDVLLLPRDQAHLLSRGNATMVSVLAPDPEQAYAWVKERALATCASYIFIVSAWEDDVGAHLVALAIPA